MSYEQLEASFKIVTPLFMGSADSNTAASFVRPPSVKGALRFWWRALAWRNAIKAAGNDTVKALKHLHAQEARLFGTAAGIKVNDENKAGQSAFLMHIEFEGKTSRFENPRAGHQYLLGQGLYNFRKGVLKEALSEGQSFTLKMRTAPTQKRSLSEEDWESLCQAVKLFGLLGGLGSRARHGWGSIALESLSLGGKPQNVPLTKEAYCTELKTLLSDLPSNPPPFSAFSQKTRLDISLEGNNALSVLNTVGEQLQLYRSWGQQGKVNQHTAEQNFKADHDLMFKVAQRNPVETHPRRVIFGLPHNYFFGSLHRTADVNACSKSGDARRSSPLLLHIHQFEEGTAIAVHALMESLFLPNGWNIKVGNKNITTNPEWSVIKAFLDRPAFNARTSILK